MSIFFKDDISIIYHGKFENLINDLSFNFIITDPPYNINYKYPDYKDKMKNEDYIKLLSNLKNYKVIMIQYPEAFMNIINKSLGNVEKLVSWCYNSNLPKQFRLIGWFNTKPDFNLVKQPYKDPKDKRNIKLINNGSNGARLYDWWNDINLVKGHTKDKDKSFTNQIPIELLERIILLTTKKDDIILDPFFGSGSLYFACKNTGRKCIGIEQSIKHLDCFKNRLKKV